MTYNTNVEIVLLDRTPTLATPCELLNDRTASSPEATCRITVSRPSAHSAAASL